MTLIARQIVLASLNPGKLREFNALFAPLGIEVISQQDLQIPAAPEPHPTFIENALAKARQASTLSGLPSLADDSGICVEALHGAPGIHSARFAGPNANDDQNNHHLLELLKNESNRRAKYVCALVYIQHATDPEPVIATGIWHGEIIDTPKGTEGFGYDPYFYLAEYQQTAAELDPQLKNTMSHRARAMHELLQKLRHE
jgi:XTP/dITP diphosphohydrolase